MMTYALSASLRDRAPMKLAVPDMISNSYFPARPRSNLDFSAEGLDVALELIFPVDKAYAAMRDGAVDFVGGSAHSALAAFPNGTASSCSARKAQGMYWFLVMHADLKAKRGDLNVVKGRSIGAAPWVDMGLRGLLTKPASISRATTSRSRRCPARGRRHQFRRHRGQGAGGAQDRRLLGQRHGRGSGGAPRRRHGRARRAARRRPEGLLQLHDGVDRDDRCVDRTRAGDSRRRGARDRQDASGA